MENDVFHIHDISVFVLFFHLSGFYLIYLYYYWKCMFPKDIKVLHMDACFNAYALPFLNKSVRYWLSNYTVSVWVLCLIKYDTSFCFDTATTTSSEILSYKNSFSSLYMLSKHINYISFLFHFIKDRNKEAVVKIHVNTSAFILS